MSSRLIFSPSIKAVRIGSGNPLKNSFASRGFILESATLLAVGEVVGAVAGCALLRAITGACPIVALPRMSSITIHFIVLLREPTTASPLTPATVATVVSWYE